MLLLHGTWQVRERVCDDLCTQRVQKVVWSRAYKCMLSEGVQPGTRNATSVRQCLQPARDLHTRRVLHAQCKRGCEMSATSMTRINETRRRFEVYTNAPPHRAATQTEARTSGGRGKVSFISWHAWTLVQDAAGVRMPYLVMVNESSTLPVADSTKEYVMLCAPANCR